MSNTERQRRFRERHPGYYGRYHRRQKAAIDRALAMKDANAPAPVPAATPALPGPIVHPALLALTMAPAPLALPAPAELIVIPGINTISEIIPLPTL